MGGASSNPVTVPCVFLFLFFFCFRLFFDFIFLLIHLFIDIIHYPFQTVYRFNDCKQCIPYCVDAFSSISHIRSMFDNVPFDGHFV